MNAAVAGIIQLLMGNPAGAAQAPGRAAADYHSKAGSRPISRWARFSELLGGLVEENGSVGEKPKKDGASADGPTAVYPFFPPEQGKQIARSLFNTPNLEPMPAAGAENATASTGTAPEPERGDWAPFSTTPQTKTAESAPEATAGPSSATEVEEFALPTNAAQSPVAFEPVASGKTLPALEVHGPAPAAEVAPIKEERVHTTTDSGQSQLLDRSFDFQTVVSREESNSTPTVKAPVFPLPSGWLSGYANSNVRREISRRQESGGEPTGRAISEGSSGRTPVDLKSATLDEDCVTEFPAAAAADTGIAPLAQATSDSLRLGPTFSQAPAAHVPADAAATGLYPGRYPAREAPANLAFGARVVPLEATEPAAPVTGADDQIPVSTPAKPETDKTPAAPATHFSSDAKKEHSSDAAVRPSGVEPRVVSSLTPAASPEAPEPPAGESTRAAPAVPDPRPSGVTDGTALPAAGPAREIQLQFHQGEQRVDVRVIERGGELRVAVRTPDTQLAGALRTDLPALSTRLEQTGFRAETWHPAISHESARPGSHAAASLLDSSDARNGSRQGGQPQPDPRQRKPSTADTAKTQRKEFRWFISQLP